VAFDIILWRKMMRNFLVTKNGGENIHSPPAWGEILPHGTIDTVMFYGIVAFFNNTMTKSIGIHTP